MEARSPACSMAGPEVVFIWTPISTAMMLQRVVFPSPGGPYSSTWSTDRSLRRRAASSSTFRFALIFSCPIYSPRRRGRRLPSMACSSSLMRGETSRSLIVLSRETDVLLVPCFHYIRVPRQGRGGRFESPAGCVQDAVCYNSDMDDSEPLHQENTEDDSEINVIDIPISEAKNDWSLRVSRAFLDWQRSVSPIEVARLL